MRRPRIVVSLITAENDYQAEQAVAAEDAARSLGADVQILFADGDSIEQSQQVLSFVQAKESERPDGIIFEPIGAPALAQVARAAVTAGIAWVVLNKQVKYVKELRSISKAPVFMVTNDHLEIGRIQGRQLATLLPNGGPILCIEGIATSDPCKLRTLGMRETLPANIQVKTLRGVWTEVSAFHAVQSHLRLSTSRHEEIVAVAAQNDAMAMGARKAFQEFARESNYSERWDKIPFLGIDGVPKSGQAWVRSSVLTATIVAPPLAGPAVGMLVRALQTGTPPPEITLLAPYSFPPLSAFKSDRSKSATAAG